MERIYSEEIDATYLKLKAYTDICPTPEKLAEIDKMYMEKCEEANRLKSTINNAIEQMKQAKYSEHDAACDNELFQINCGIDTCIEALEKQAPYIPREYKGTAWDGVGVCKCGAVFLNKTTNYCGNCGQRLDWGD